MPAPVPEGKESDNVRAEQGPCAARFEEVWNQGKLTVIDELTASNATYHDPNVPGGKFTGPEGMKQFVQIYRGAFPTYASRSTTRSRRATRSLPGGPQLAPTRAS